MSAENKAGRLQLENVLADYPGLASEIDLLVFALENEIALTPGWNLESLKKTFLSQFHLEAIRRRMLILTAQIKNAEAAGKKELVKSLSFEFNNLATQLSKFHIQHEFQAKKA